MWKAAKTHTSEECRHHVHCARDARLKDPDFTVCRPRHRPNKPQHVACLPRADTPITVWEYRLDGGIGDNAPMHPVTLSEPFHPQNPPAAAGFDDPASLLHACHERVQERCRLLQRLLQHVAAQGADTQAQEAAANILRYFDLAAPHHHEDEERHVFPRLLASNDPELVQCVRTLQQQHHEMAANWQQLRPLLLAVQQGQAPDLTAHTALIDRFVALYETHIALEEGLAFPAGFAGMPSEQRTQMGEEMASRRGATRLPPKD